MALPVALAALAQKMILSKIEAAEQNLRYAIMLFFHRSLPVPIETLNSAACGILRPMAKKRGVEPFLHDSLLVKDEFRKKWIGILHEAANFFKHADKDDGSSFNYKEETTHFLLAETCYLYRHLASNNHLSYRQLKEAIVFEIWFALKYPHLLKEGASLTNLPGGEHLVRADPNDYEFWIEAVGSNWG